MGREYGISNLVPYAAAPAVGLAGDTYYNTASKKMYLSDGTSWVEANGSNFALANYFYGVGSTPASVASGVETAIAWTLIYSNVITVSGTGLYFNSTGKYRVAWQISCNATGAAVAWDTRIKHFSAAAVLRTTRSFVPYGVTASGYWGVAAGEAIIDAVSGDYVQIFMQPAGNINTDMTRSFVEIIPIGGAMGATGPQGPDITAVQSNYWFGSVSGPAGALGTDVLTNAAWATTRTNGFTLASSNQRITPALASKYLVTVALSFSTGAAATAWTRAYINHYNSSNTLLSTVNPLGGGAPTNGYAQAVSTGVFDMAIGDYLTVQGAINNAVGAFTSQSFCSVVPVGGTKGDKGDKGDPGATNIAVWG